MPLLQELAHHALQIALAHLAVRDRDARLGQELLQFFAHHLDRGDVVVQEKNLPTALQFPQCGLADDARRIRRDESADRKAPFRRRGDHRQIAQALERHRERARDRRRGEREHVDLRPQRLQRFLLAHAEAVLLVDDHEAQALELHVALQELVRADGDVDFACGKAFQRRRRLLAALEARELRQLDRPVGEAVGKSVEMLLGQERRGREHRDLHVVGDGDEGGSQCDFRLAETDVAADEAVHGLAALHVVDGSRDGGRLVRRLLEAEAFGEGLVVVLVQLEGVA